MSKTNKRQISALINTSADDCKVSLRFFKADGLPILREALRQAEATEQKTKAGHIRRRIRQLETFRD